MNDITLREHLRQIAKLPRPKARKLVHCDRCQQDLPAGCIGYKCPQHIRPKRKVVENVVDNFVENDVKPME